VEKIAKKEFLVNLGGGKVECRELDLSNISELRSGVKISSPV
jgi:hypothetical protein